MVMIFTLARKRNSNAQLFDKDPRCCQSVHVIFLEQPHRTNREYCGCVEFGTASAMSRQIGGFEYDAIVLETFVVGCAELRF